MKENNDFNDAHNIYKISNVLCEIKSRNSDLRIGQLLYIFIENMKAAGIDPFYMDDKQFVEEFEKWFDGVKKSII